MTVAFEMKLYLRRLMRNLYLEPFTNQMIQTAALDGEIDIVGSDATRQRSRCH